mgnify:FL=1
MHIVNAKGILSAQNGINIYRGCSHGCIYCDSRSKCYQMSHSFEDIEVKANAAQLLENALKRKRKPCMIGTGSMSDPYIPLEKNLCNMRKCLEIIDKYGFGVSILTKSNLILRDLDLLKSINQKTKVVVQITLTTYNEKLCKILEPNVSTSYERFKVLEIMRDNCIPTIVWLDPILPFINDTEENIRGILSYCEKAKVRGIMCFGMGLTLRTGNREYFYKKLDEHFPNLKERYIQKYGNRYEVTSSKNKELMQILISFCRKLGIMYNIDEIFSYLSEFKQSENEQLNFFDIL